MILVIDGVPRRVTFTTLEPTMPDTALLAALANAMDVSPGTAEETIAHVRRLHRDLMTARQEASRLAQELEDAHDRGADANERANYYEGLPRPILSVPATIVDAGGLDRRKPGVTIVLADGRRTLVTLLAPEAMVVAAGGHLYRPVLLQLVAAPDDAAPDDDFL